MVTLSDNVLLYADIQCNAGKNASCCGSGTGSEAFPTRGLMLVIKSTRYKNYNQKKTYKIASTCVCVHVLACVSLKNSSS